MRATVWVSRERDWMGGHYSASQLARPPTSLAIKEAAAAKGGVVAAIRSPTFLPGRATSMALASATSLGAQAALG